ncbi:hypothetical protein N7481_013195 [Penicillium waksmanii]|uniref:uncharacterized protein n=1 Tax=Penicillium waksmanii TaxID=69791 RepID=UPI00254971CE|nr:uncharacterized protein N7481_013195 [Penicillium waksmanii]KAJ5966481.1 hypothetical protein N7481_013195 [Penicillium waksmanii]
MGLFNVKFDEATAAAPLQDEGNRDTKKYSHPNQSPRNQVTHRKDLASSIQDDLSLSSTSSLSRWIDPIDWKEDETNSSSVEAAFNESLRTSNDDGDYENYCDALKYLKADI